MEEMSRVYHSNILENVEYVEYSAVLLYQYLPALTDCDRIKRVWGHFFRDFYNGGTQFSFSHSAK